MTVMWSTFNVSLSGNQISLTNSDWPEPDPDAEFKEVYVQEKIKVLGIDGGELRYYNGTTYEDGTIDSSYYKYWGHSQYYRDGPEGGWGSGMGIMNGKPNDNYYHDFNNVLYYYLEGNQTYNSENPMARIFKVIDPPVYPS